MHMNVADYFTSQGFLVFAYDATGTDKSEGASIEGLPQGVIDLDYALRYVKQCAEYQDLPIALFGHSWGGYCVGNVLNYHPDVRAAVLVAGFDRSTDLIEQQGETMIGFAIHLFMPYLSLYERLRFGEYARLSASWTGLRLRMRGSWWSTAEMIRLFSRKTDLTDFSMCTVRTPVFPLLNMKTEVITSCWILS